MHTNNHDAYFNIGKIYQKQNLLDLSIENYLKSIQININFPMVIIIQESSIHN